MNNVVRGLGSLKNSALRSALVGGILTISIALAMIMFVACSSSAAQILSLKQNVGTELKVKERDSPSADSGEDKNFGPFSEEMVKNIEKVSHIVKVKKTIVDKGDKPIQGQGSERTSLPPLTLAEQGRESAEGANNPRIPTIMGVDENGEKEVKNSVAERQDVPFEGRYLQPGDSRKALLTRALAEKGKLKIEDTVKLYGHEFTIVGLMGDSLPKGEKKQHSGTREDTPTVLIPLADMKEISGIKSYSMIAPIVDNIDNVTKAVDHVQNTVGGKAKVEAPIDDNKGLIDSLMNLQSFIWFGFFSAIIISGLIIFFLMFLMVRSRRQEIGTFKAIGGRTGALLTQYATEGIALALLASTAALMATLLLAQEITRSIFSGVGDPTANTSGTASSLTMNASNIPVDVGSSLSALGIMLIVASIGVMIPVALAARVRPVEAMRQE